MKYKLYVFDMDGTILDTLIDLKDALNYSLAVYDLGSRTIDEVRGFVGNGIRRLIELGVPENTESAMIDKVFDTFNEYYAVHCTDTTKPYVGVVEVIKEIRKNGCKTAVVSNKADYGVKELCNRFFKGLFDVEIGLKDGIRKKPYPDSVNAVLEQLEVDKKDAVYIGDSDVDYQTATNAGLKCISVEWGFKSREFLEKLNDYAIISNPKELLNY